MVKTFFDWSCTDLLGLANLIHVDGLQVSSSYLKILLELICKRVTGVELSSTQSVQIDKHKILFLYTLRRMQGDRFYKVHQQ